MCNRLESCLRTIIAAMEPGLIDRDHRDEHLERLFAIVAAMEPGLIDRDHLAITVITLTSSSAAMLVHPGED